MIKKKNYLFLSLILMNLKSWKLNGCGKKRETKKKTRTSKLRQRPLFIPFIFETSTLAPQVLSNQFGQILI